MAWSRCLPHKDRPRQWWHDSKRPEYAMPTCQLDHIVVTSISLAAGVTWVEAALGVPLQAGGEHPRMGTHNALLRLGASVYLEVIAANPEVLAPGRPRWFGLDRLASDASPRLATWVARTDDIQAAPLRQQTHGQVEPMSRDDLRWLITIPADGSLPGGGVVPTLIEWQTAQHPAMLLQDKGCTLVQLAGFHPDSDRIKQILAPLGLQGAIAVHPLAPGTPPYLVAHIETPHGLRTLGGPDS